MPTDTPQAADARRERLAQCLYRGATGPEGHNALAWAHRAADAILEAQQAEAVRLAAEAVRQASAMLAERWSEVQELETRLEAQQAETARLAERVAALERRLDEVFDAHSIEDWAEVLAIYMAKLDRLALRIPCRECDRPDLCRIIKPGTRPCDQRAERPPTADPETDAGFYRTIRRIYTGARKQGETQDRSVERCVEAYQGFGLAEQARVAAALERARESVAPLVEREQEGERAVDRSLILKAQPAPPSPAAPPKWWETVRGIVADIHNASSAADKAVYEACLQDCIKALQREARAQGVRELIEARRFPILRPGDGPKSVPWWFVAHHEKTAQQTHTQSIERIAERGGLTARELWSLVNDQRFNAHYPDDAWLRAWLTGVTDLRVALSHGATPEEASE